MLQVSNTQNNAALQQAYLSTLQHTRPAIWTADQSAQAILPRPMPEQGCGCEGIFQSAMQTVMAMFEKVVSALMSLIGRGPANASTWSQSDFPNIGNGGTTGGIIRPADTSQLGSVESDPSLFDQLGELVDKGRDFWSSGKETWNTVKDTAGEWWDTATDWAGSAWSAVTDGASAVGDWVSGIYNWFTS